MNKSLAALLFAGSFFFCRQSVHAQNYAWDAKPVLHAVPDAYKKESAVFILDKRHIKYAVDPAKEDIEVYRTIHRIIRLLDDKGVEYFNKMTIGAAAGAEIQNVQGRTIKANGKVVSLDKAQIKTNKDEQGTLQYHLAFEGVEKGDEVEMFYTEKRPFAIFGTEMMQFSLPVAKAKFQLEVPAHLRFESKGYNGFPATKDTTAGNVNYYTAEQSDIDALEEEEYSDLTPALQRMEYKLAFSGNSEVRLYTWNDLAKRIYEIAYTFNDKELKAAEKFLAPLNLKNLAEEEKIKTIEEAIKKEIVVNDELQDDSYRYLTTILEKKTAGETGMLRLHTACFKAAGIQHEVGLTSNRFQFPVDDKFENWNKLDIYLVYFPKTKEYLMPAAGTLRYPAIPAAARENKGVFCKVTTVGNLTSAIASLRSIAALPLEESANNIEADVSFDAETMEPEIKFRHLFKGYNAFSIREAVTFIPKDKEKDLALSLVGITENPDDLLSFTFKNKGLEHYSDNKPVEMESKVKADPLMEKAGNKWLFKVGDVIGRQAEMYQDKKRKLAINMPYAHSLVRDITLNIPEGYKVSNPEAVRIAVSDKEKSMSFVSDYTLEGSKMVIHINEFYSRSSYPISEIDAFRKVINAAADFNKVTLVMEKK